MADEKQRRDQLVKSLQQIETWRQAFFDIVDDIGGWRGHEHKRPGPENKSAGWSDPAVPILQVHQGSHSDCIQLSLLAATRTVIAIVTERSRADVGCIQRLHDWAVKWCCDHSAETIPAQAELWRTMDQADIILGATHDAIYSEAIAVQKPTASAASDPTAKVLANLTEMVELMRPHVLKFGKHAKANVLIKACGCRRQDGLAALRDLKAAGEWLGPKSGNDKGKVPRSRNQGTP